MYNIIIEKHRLLSSFDVGADPYAVINENTSIAEWRSACDLLPWFQLYPILNKDFNISKNVSKEEWMKVLEPSKSKKIIDLCGFISKKSDVTIVKSVNLFGIESIQAGFYNCFINRLNNRSVFTNSIKPSSKISDYLDAYLNEIVSEVLYFSKGIPIIENIDLNKNQLNKKGLLSFFYRKKYDIRFRNISTFEELITELIKVNRLDIS